MTDPPAAVLSRINSMRAMHLLAPLRPDAALARAASFQAHDMARHNYVGHVSVGGGRLEARVAAAGSPDPPPAPAGKVLRGAFAPGRLPVGVELTFVRADEPEFAAAEVKRIGAAKRVPLVTIEPWRGLPNAAAERAWGSVFAGPAGWVRVMHEFNGDRYPWADGDARSFRAAWAYWRDVVRAAGPHWGLMWSPNIGYPGSKPIAPFWPGTESADAIGISGYARHGESPAELFGPSMHDLRALAPGLPVWIAETAAPRGPKQRRFAAALADYAEAQGLAGVVWFNANKAGQGPDERNWELSPGAADALLGRERPRRERREPRERDER